MIIWDRPDNILLLIFVFNYITLSIKLQLSSTLTGTFRGIEKLPKVEEDAKLTEMMKTEKVPYENSKTQRLVNTHQNEIENILAVFISSMAFLLSNTLTNKLSVASGWVHCVAGGILLTTFTFSRFIYAAFYFLGLQPWRSIVFLIGVIVNVIFWIWTIVSLFT